ncbi:regulator of G protein-like protein [Xylariaceae sp. FL0016]|nr:regulator of G protein-like protein [Xylariaceae sp. FL0016]
MPSKFFRPFQARHSAKEPLSESKCVFYLNEAEKFQRTIHRKLRFDAIIKNNTLPPCSLNDFTDYLVYVERNAECLQFFLWYCDYVQRWSQLPKSARDLSPLWDTTTTSISRTSHSRSSSLGERTDKVTRILAIMDKKATGQSEKPASAGRRPKSSHQQTKPNFSWPRSPIAETGAERNDQNDWEPFSVQPLREEVTQIACHYISASGPRSLNLTCQDRTSCMHAIQQTTHPSAFLPAFAAAEAMLRGQSHPDFIRWSVRNSNRPRALFTMMLGSVLTMMATAMVILLVLTPLNRFIRFCALPLWGLGFSFLLTGRRGVCLFHHWHCRRDMRPWEQFVDAGLESGENSKPYFNEDKRPASHSSSTVDPLRKESLQALGPANQFDGAPWARMYAKKPVWRKVFEDTVVIQNKRLQAMQDQAVHGALMWASFLMVVFTIGSVCIPSIDLLIM